MEVRISGEDWGSLKAHVNGAAPAEEGGFAAITLSTDGRHPVLLVRELILPGPEDWMHQGAHWLTPRTSYINRAVVRADYLNCGLLFFHSHPDPGHPAGLSPIDVASTELLFNNLEKILPGRPLASAVITPEGAAGVVREGGRERDLESIVVIGGRIERVTAQRRSGLAPAIASSADRQVRAFGKQAQAILSGLRVGVVGAGGTGSAALEQLARLGVRHVLVVDDDELDASNVSRVFGSTAADVSKSPAKVEIASRNYKAILPGAAVRVLKKNITEPGVAAALLGCDVVFSCTDTDSSRAILNDLAYSCYVPVIDTGCKIDMRDGKPRAVLGRSRLLRPGLPCLWCTGAIDGRRVLMESMSPTERAKLEASGYGFNEGPQPMVVHLTTLVAALAVSEFLRLFAGLGEPHQGDYQLVDLAINSMTQVSSTIDPNCRCGKLRARGPTGLP